MKYLLYYTYKENKSDWKPSYGHLYYWIDGLDTMGRKTMRSDMGDQTSDLNFAFKCLERADKDHSEHMWKIVEKQ